MVGVCVFELVACWQQPVGTGRLLALVNWPLARCQTALAGAQKADIFKTAGRIVILLGHKYCTYGIYVS